MPTVREVLLEIQWRQHALAEVTLVILHRGAPGDEARIPGDQVRALGRSFFDVERPHGETRIPYHRILRLERGGEVIWARAPG